MLEQHKETVAVFAGTFDPFTCGHENIVRRALPFFSKIIIAIGENSTKNCLFQLEKRIFLINKAFTDCKKIEVCSYRGLTVDFCKQQNVNIIIRGLRNSSDFENEQIIAQVNKYLYNNIETFFLTTNPEYSFVSSSVFREIYKNGGNISAFLPTNISVEDIKL